MDSPLLSPPALLALSLLLLALYIARRRRGGGRNRNYPPVAGTVFHQLLNFGRLMEYHTELAHRYRTFRMLTPTCNYVYTVEPANVEYILKTNFANYGKGVMTHDVLEDLLGDGIFNVDGAKWRHQRKAASHEFSTRVLRDYSSGVFRDTATGLAGIVAVAAGAGERRLDVADLLMRSTLDSIFKVGFGVSLGVLSGCSDEVAAAFARAFDDASEQLLYRFFDLSWKVKRLLSISSEAAMKRSIRTIDGFVYGVIDRKIEQMGRDQQEFVSSPQQPRPSGCSGARLAAPALLFFTDTHGGVYLCQAKKEDILSSMVDLIHRYEAATNKQLCHEASYYADRKDELFINVTEELQVKINENGCHNDAAATGVEMEETTMVEPLLPQSEKSADYPGLRSWVRH
ncbi:unnamed protein product [Miscanthus lutarioriparius]|uniref:Cytochrome P450 n=1 Tax=Miscanthus lutarioriparius TaxID=422564 RepID=A0A811QX09_9POAL|nr:unnamed protein product [Miscanthus lutarioriparius]